MRLRGIATALSFFILPAALPAQAPDTGQIVRAVEIQRNDIFDAVENTSWLTRLGNGLHITTREGVVRRELLIAPGEPYDSARAAETARNLRTLGIFRRVQVDTVRTDSGLVMRVVTSDGWSTRPDFRFRSTGGQADYTVAFIEDNLFGTATQASIKYRNSTDRTSTSFGFLQPRFLSRTIRLGLEYQDRSDGRRYGALVGRPFYSLNSRSSYLFLLDDRRERVLRFSNGERIASDSLRRRYTLARFEGAVALTSSSAGYLRAGVIGQYREDAFRPEAPDSGFPAMGKTPSTGAVGLYVEARRAHFILTRGFVGFAREEDVDVSTAVRVGAMVAPKSFGYERDGIAPFISGRTGTSFGAGFLFADLHANGLYDSGGLDSGSVTLGATMVLQPAPRHSIVLHGDAGWIRNPLPGEDFDLGLGSGPRAFHSHSFTGDRTYYASAEYRYTLVQELWKLVGVGLAGFVDHGGSWYNGSPRRTGWDAGIGVRLGASRAAGVEAIRIDLARRFATDVDGAGWVIVVGKGLTFSTAPGANRGS
ncbi:MAG: hypothetical protein ABI679_15015 [Gemmatimonadota bacterium]